MSIARHHAEWLSLVEASGPFLSLPVLLEVFPNGLEAHDPEHMRREKELRLLGTKDRSPELGLGVLEACAAKGEAALLKFSKDETGRSLSALQKALKISDEDSQDHRSRQRLLMN